MIRATTGVPEASAGPSPCAESTACGRRLAVLPDSSLCQSELPLDWYQPEFRPYAEEYMLERDRGEEAVLRWLDAYVRPALAHFGDELLLLAHYYMGGQIVRLVERYGGRIGDSYQLALQARDNPERTVIVESAVHFMAESISLLAGEHQRVSITNPKAGCTMEMWAKEAMVRPVADALVERYGDDLVIVAYMNTSGRLKALAGRTGGAVCTSSNAARVLDWALKRARKVLFVPDRHLGANAAAQAGVDPEEVIALTSPRLGPVNLPDAKALDRARLILWGSECGVHTVFSGAQARWFKRRGWRVIVHPESPPDAVAEADGVGSTAYLWKQVTSAPSGSRLAVGTEGHFVRHAQRAALARGVQVRHLADVPGSPAAGCACATMSRNDPPHLAGLMDLLKQGRAPSMNHVLPGDVVDEATMSRDRLGASRRDEVVQRARAAMLRMIEITESAR